MAIVVIGATCSLGEAVVDKLLSMDMDVVAIEESHKTRNVLLKYSDATLSEQGDGYSISFDGSTADIIVGDNLLIHDLIPTRNDRWMSDEFRNWFIGKDCEKRPRYWLSVMDAANAIAHQHCLERTSPIYTCVEEENGLTTTRKQNSKCYGRGQIRGKLVNLLRRHCLVMI